jgi:bacillithiol biosynthesis deacetylase BshB1
MTPLHILAFGAHPDDVELSAAGTLLSHKEKGFRIGICDLTRGELGTRGSADLRDQEAAKSSAILGLDFRTNLNLGDGFFEETEETLLALIRVIRHTQPKIVLANALQDRHPDHARAASLTARACFLAGLPKIQTEWEGQTQYAHRPQTVYHYIQDRYTEPHLVIDIGDHLETKMQSILAFSSQFYDPNSQEPETPISGEAFLEGIRARAQAFGRLISCTYAEGFHTQKPIGALNLLDLH